MNKSVKSSQKLKLRNASKEKGKKKWIPTVADAAVC